MGPPVSRRLEAVLLALVCLALAWFYVWSSRSNNERWKYGREQRDYFNLAIDGWLDGHLYLKVDVQPEMLALADPYDPATRPPGIGLHDASFYKGKYYVYFGMAPVVVLMLPYRLITGVDLPLAVAVIIFAYGGFFAMSALWLDIRRRYFPGTGTAVSVLMVFTLGLVNLGPVLIRRPHMWELPIGAGYCFAMLMLLCLWRSLHAEVVRKRARWFGAAGLMLGLAIASRPTYLLASPLLFLPLALWWREARRLPWRPAWSAFIPLAFVGAAMAWHNYARFGDPLQFGQAYQLSLDYESKMQHFSPRYLGFNTWRYFFSVAEWSRYFPFIAPAELPPKPPGFSGHDDVYGVMVNLPFAWLAFLAPLALWHREAGERWRIAVWLLTALVLFGVMAGVLLCFFGSLARYEVDFTPTLMLLAAIGVLAMERWLREKGSGVARWVARAVWVTAAVASAVFGALFSVQLTQRFQHINPEGAQAVARLLNPVPYFFERLVGVRYGPAELGLRVPRLAAGEERVVATIGGGKTPHRVVVRGIDDAGAQIGFRTTDGGEAFSRRLAIDGSKSHRIKVSSPALFPPLAHPFYGNARPEEIAAQTSRLRLDFDGETVIDQTQRIPAPGNRRVKPVGDVSVTIQSPEPVARPDYFVRAWVRLPADRVERSEPLFSFTEGKHHALFMVRYLGGDRVRLGWNGGAGESHESAALAVAGGYGHEVTLQFGTLKPGPMRQLQVRIDGMLSWTHEVAWPFEGAPTTVDGKNDGRLAGCADVFMGRIHGVQVGASGRDPLVESGDTLRLRVQFPVGRKGYREPFIVTGRRGGAELLIVEYVDDKSIRFLLDHWGAPPLLSPVIPIDYTQPQELIVCMGALSALMSDLQTEPGKLGRMIVVLNGQRVWENSSWYFYVVDADEIAIGRNAVGGTSCGPAFTGEILGVERIPRY